MPLVTDAYARRILGWRTATSMTTELVLDAIEQAIWVREREGRTQIGVLEDGVLAEHFRGRDLDDAEAERFAGLVRASAPRAELEAAALAHPREYVDALAAAIPESGMVDLGEVVEPHVAIAHFELVSA